MAHCSQTTNEFDTTSLLFPGKPRSDDFAIFEMMFRDKFPIEIIVSN